MTFETKFNYQDRLWVIHSYDYGKDVPCLACNGDGGADIPGTKIRITCQECEGTGAVKAADPQHSVRFAEITGINARYSWDKLSISYNFAFAFPKEGVNVIRGNYVAGEDAFFATREEAEARVASLTSR